MKMVPCFYEKNNIAMWNLHWGNNTLIFKKYLEVTVFFSFEIHSDTEVIQSKAKKKKKVTIE